MSPFLHVFGVYVFVLTVWAEFAQGGHETYEEEKMAVAHHVEEKGA